MVLAHTTVVVMLSLAAFDLLELAAGVATATGAAADFSLATYLNC